MTCQRIRDRLDRSYSKHLVDGRVAYNRDKNKVMHMLETSRFMKCDAVRFVDMKQD